MDTRIEWTFTPLLSLQDYAQPLPVLGVLPLPREALDPMVTLEADETFA